MNRRLLGECLGHGWDCSSTDRTCSQAHRSIFRNADPFQSVQLPDVVEEVLEEGVARSVAFNPRGTILAGPNTHLLRQQCSHLLQFVACVQYNEPCALDVLLQSMSHIKAMSAFRSRLRGRQDRAVGL